MAETNVYEAIIVGGGMSGSWVAKELCDKGIKTLMLERGRDVKHIKDYPTTNLNQWEFPHRDRLTHDLIEKNPVVSKCYAFKESTEHFFVKDNEHPYVQDKPFDWIRGYQVGGKSIMWARQVQRWSDYDFEGPLRDGFAVDWPIRYKDLAPWYSHVEKFIGVSGNKDGLDILPDGEFLPPFGLTCIDQHFIDSVSQHYKDRHVIYGRCAHLSRQEEIHRQQGRGQCQNRTICERGCPFGGYFNANSSTIPWALRTGNLTLRPHSVVHSITYKDGKATGVMVIDALTKESTEYKAKVIFVNAATFNTNLILLNSKSDRFPNGLGNDSGTLGRYVAFHNYRASMRATYEGYSDKITDGRSPASAYIPRFRNIKKQETDFLRGYAAGFYSGRYSYREQNGNGKALLNSLLGPEKYSQWSISSHIMGETIPKETNTITLDTEQKDEWGIPLLKADISYDDNDEKMIADYFNEFTDMFEKAGFSDITKHDSHQAPGLDIHEMGGVRMGHDPNTSMLNKWNQMHACPNVFVTDGAAMTSVSTQNPSLTFMALSARAANYAVELLKKGELS